MKKSKKSWKKKSSSRKRTSSKKKSSKEKSLKEGSSDSLKDRPLAEKIIIGICIFILIIFPSIFILFSIGLAIFMGVEDQIDTKEEHIEKRTSNEEMFGKYLYLDKIDEDVYAVVSEDEDPERRLVWDEDFCGYYDDLSNGYVWYDVKREKWKYWFKDISPDYKDYGWMVYDSNGWRIEREYQDWIKLPESYDRSKLWYIKQSE
ncbi:hypothetical protein SAMN02910369_02154 [Lachnospiraceae bacterium NE2001]|nr:hypothetical protein SAMN02910369_02154 [Lachnospiraceae bacterium NE2001]